MKADGEVDRAPARAGCILLLDRALAVLLPSLEPDYATVCLWDYPDARAMIEHIGADVRVVLTYGGLAVAPALVEALPNLEVMMSAGVGYDGIDLAHAHAHGVRVTNAAGANAPDVADVAVGLTLAATRDIVSGHLRVIEERWSREDRGPCRVSLNSRRVGILGLGAIGQAVARRLEPFGCSIAWTGPHPKPDMPWPRAPDLPSLASAVDILIVTAPLTEATIGIVDRDVMDALGADGLLVNVARGELVDEVALRTALRDGRLGAAALDVQVDEPPDPETWRGVPNLIMTPHVGGHASGGLSRIREILLDNLRRFFAGEPLVNVVTAGTFA